MSTVCWRSVVIVAGIVLWAPRWSVGQLATSENLPKRLKEQQQAKSLTRELLSGVLDVQLRQLEENGLTSQDIYRDLKTMRQNLNRLVEIDMPEIVELLSAADQFPAPKQEECLIAVGQRIRTIIRQLFVERLSVLKRLKIVELADQIRRAIRLQTSVQDVTKRLMLGKESHQESTSLQLIEDQRDVKELFLHLVDTINEMCTWSGTSSTVALDSLRLLKVAAVNQHLESAIQHLHSVNFEQAADEQTQVRAGLQQLLRFVERTLGTQDFDNMIAVEKIRAITNNQELLRDETKKLPDNAPAPADVVERQSQLKQKIIQLQTDIRDNLKIQTHFQLAETAAIAATVKLLDHNHELAIAEQGRVLGNLAAIERELTEQKKSSADELAANLALNDFLQAQQEAQTELDQSLPMGQESPHDQMRNSDPSANSEDGQQLSSENAHATKLTKKVGTNAANQKVKGGAIDKEREGTEAAGTSVSRTREHDENTTTKPFKEDAWFAKLPPELRKSIRAGAGRKSPRAYEERLNKYFQSVD